MKKRKTMLIFGMSLMLLVSGCTENKTDTSSQDTNSQDTNSQDKESRSRMDNGIFGQVTEVGEDYIIIEENGQLEIKIDTDTVIKRSNRAGGGQPPEQPDGEEPREKPDREKPDGEQRPEKTDGGHPDGEADEEITIKDISEGDRVTVILGDDGTADEIRVMQRGGPEQEQDMDEKESI